MEKLTGHGRPSAHFAGEVGQHYEDLDTGDIYECRISSQYSPTHGWPVGGYVWERRAKGEDIRELFGSGGSGGSETAPAKPLYITDKGASTGTVFVLPNAPHDTYTKELMSKRDLFTELYNGRTVLYTDLTTKGGSNGDYRYQRIIDFDGMLDENNYWDLNLYYIKFDGYDETTSTLKSKLCELHIYNN